MCHPNVVDLGPEVRNPKFLVLQWGAREGHGEMDEERRLWEAIPHVPDLQCGWQILLQCVDRVATRATNPVRRARTDDAGMQRTVEVLLGGFPGDDQAKEAGRQLVTLPMKLEDWG